MERAGDSGTDYKVADSFFLSPLEGPGESRPARGNPQRFAESDRPFGPFWSLPTTSKWARRFDGRSLRERFRCSPATRDRRATEDRLPTLRSSARHRSREGGGPRVERPSLSHGFLSRRRASDGPRSL